MGENNVSNLTATESAISFRSELKEVLINGLTDLASARTAKYFFKDGVVDADRIGKIVNTIEAIKSATGNFINVEGEQYSKFDYRLPKALVDYVNAGRIYASKDAIGGSEPLFYSEKTAAEMSPLAFNKFFDDFNRNQDEGYRIPTVDNWSASIKTLEDVQYLYDEDCGTLCKFHEGGMDECTCALLHCTLPEVTNVMPKYDKPTRNGYTLWLSKQE